MKRARRTAAFPFVRLAGQEEMKLALLLNVIDPSIGGVLIMGDRGTGKSVAVRPAAQQKCKVPTHFAREWANYFHLSQLDPSCLQLWHD